MKKRYWIEYVSTSDLYAEKLQRELEMERTKAMEEKNENLKKEEEMVVVQSKAEEAP